jgi:cytochrome c-type biogenesis protein CcmH
VAIDEELKMKIASRTGITNYNLIPLLVLFLALSLALVPNMTVLAQDPTPSDDEVNRIAKQLYCPVCENTPLDHCGTEACRQWRELIRDMLAEGKSEAEIKQYFVDRFGAQVLDEPPNRLAAYIVPAIAILLGAAFLLRGFQMWMKPSMTEAGAGESEAKQISQDDYISKLEEELKKQNE